MRSPRPCTWTLDDDGVYQTNCGKSWEFTCGGIEENGVKFCPYCGGKIKDESKV